MTVPAKEAPSNGSQSARTAPTTVTLRDWLQRWTQKSRANAMLEQFDSFNSYSARSRHTKETVSAKEVHSNGTRSAQTAPTTATLWDSAKCWTKKAEQTVR
jgi:uncharacterized protein YjiS (DUF1127 family)